MDILKLASYPLQMGLGPSLTRSSCLGAISLTSNRLFYTEEILAKLINLPTLSVINSGDLYEVREKYLAQNKFTFLSVTAALASEVGTLITSSKALSMHKTSTVLHSLSLALLPLSFASLLKEGACIKAVCLQYAQCIENLKRI